MTSLFGPWARTNAGSAVGAPFTTKPAAGVPTTPTSTGTSRTITSCHSRSMDGGSICSTLSPGGTGMTLGSNTTRVSLPPRTSRWMLPMSSACRSSSVERGPRTVTRMEAGMGVIRTRFAVSGGVRATTLMGILRCASCEPCASE